MYGFVFPQGAYGHPDRRIVHGLAGFHSSDRGILDVELGDILALTSEHVNLEAIRPIELTGVVEINEEIRNQIVLVGVCPGSLPRGALTGSVRKALQVEKFQSTKNEAKTPKNGDIVNFKKNNGIWHLEKSSSPLSLIDYETPGRNP